MAVSRNVRQLPRDTDARRSLAASWGAFEQVPDTRLVLWGGCHGNRAREISWKLLSVLFTFGYPKHISLREVHIFKVKINRMYTIKLINDID